MIHPLALDIIKQEETAGRVPLEPYQDRAGVWTIGYGHTGRIDGALVQDIDSITLETAEDLLEEDILWAESVVGGMVRVPLTDLQYGALVSLVFNIGSGNFSTSNMLEHLNNGRYDLATWEFRKWRRSGGEITPGLLSRRGREEQLFRLSNVAPSSGGDT